MIRVIFLACGLFLVLVGVECMCVEEFHLTTPNRLSIAQARMRGDTTKTNIIKPAEWWPWSLLSSGAIVSLYSIYLKKNA